MLLSNGGTVRAHVADASGTASIASSIAEGWGRGTPKELGNRLRIAAGSLLEVESDLLLSARLGYVTDEDVRELHRAIGEIGSQLTAWRRSLKS